MPSSSLLLSVGTVLSALSSSALATKYKLGDSYAGSDIPYPSGKSSTPCTSSSAAGYKSSPAPYSPEISSLPAYIQSSALPYGPSSAADYYGSQSSSVADYYPESTPAAYLESGKPYEPSKSYTTATYTTSYVDVCETGYTTIKTTHIVTYCPSEVTSTPSAAYYPPGFTTTEKYCAKGCGDHPTTVTLTVPDREYPKPTEPAKPYKPSPSAKDCEIYSSEAPAKYYPEKYPFSAPAPEKFYPSSTPAPEKYYPSAPAPEKYPSSAPAPEKYYPSSAPAPEYEPYRPSKPSAPISVPSYEEKPNHSSAPSYGEKPSNAYPSKPTPTVYATKVLTLSVVPVPESEYYAQTSAARVPAPHCGTPGAPACPEGHYTAPTPAPHCGTPGAPACPEGGYSAPSGGYSAPVGGYKNENVTISFATGTGKPSASYSAPPAYFTGAAASVRVGGMLAGGMAAALAWLL